MTNHPSDEELNDLVDATFARVEQRLLDHVSNCSRCQAEVASIRALIHRSRALDASATPPDDLWPAIEMAGTLVRRRLRLQQLSRILPLAATLFAVISLSAVGYYRSDWSWRGMQPQVSAPPRASVAITRAVPDGELVQRAAIAIGDSALYGRRLDDLADSLTPRDRDAMAASPVLTARRTEIDSLVGLVIASPRNAEAANALGRALDGWYFDVQRLRRDLSRN
jgi:hypothetical protein